MDVITITKDNFKEEILNAQVPVLLDFWASWCGPCRMVSPIVDQIAQEVSTIKVGKINVDEQNELAVKYKIMTIPTLMVIENGEIVAQTAGVKSKKDILGMLGL